MTEEARKLADELKPCPFCGGKAERYDDHDTGSTNEGMSCITCKSCGASSAMHGERKENLVDSWNTRAALRSQPGTLAREEVQLQARKFHDERWIDIYPAQVEAMSQAGHQLRAIERTPSHEAGPITTEQLDRLQFGKVLHDRPHEAGTQEPVAWATENQIITGAMAIARSQGHDPDEPAPLTAMCTEYNTPVPWWMVFVEESEACLKAVAAPASQDATREALDRVLIEAMGWHPSENGPSYGTARKELSAKIDAALASPARADRAVTAAFPDQSGPSNGEEA